MALAGVCLPTGWFTPRLLPLCWMRKLRRLRRLWRLQGGSKMAAVSFQSAHVYILFGKPSRSMSQALRLTTAGTTFYNLGHASHEPSIVAIVAIVAMSAKSEIGEDRNVPLPVHKKCQSASFRKWLNDCKPIRTSAILEASVPRVITLSIVISRCIPSHQCLCRTKPSFPFSGELSSVSPLSLFQASRCTRSGANGIASTKVSSPLTENHAIYLVASR